MMGHTHISLKDPKDSARCLTIQKDISIRKHTEEGVALRDYSTDGHRRERCPNGKGTNR